MVKYKHFLSDAISSSIWWIFTKDNKHFYPFWPLNFLSSLSSLLLTRYGSQFLCVAASHYTPNYSHSCTSSLHFLFPFFSHLSVLSFQFTHLFATTGHLLSIYPILSVFLFFIRFCGCNIFGGHNKHDLSTVKKIYVGHVLWEHIHNQYIFVQRPEFCEKSADTKAHMIFEYASIMLWAHNANTEIYAHTRAFMHSQIHTHALWYFYVMLKHNFSLKFAAPCWK